MSRIDNCHITIHTLMSVFITYTVCDVTLIIRLPKNSNAFMDLIHHKNNSFHENELRYQI